MLDELNESREFIKVLEKRRVKLYLKDNTNRLQIGTEIERERLRIGREWLLIQLRLSCELT